MDEAEIIKRNIIGLRDRINNAASRSGRSGNEINMVAVSKFRTVAEVRAVIDAGVSDIGENRVQEALAKRPELKGEFTFRMIGHLQRNKAAEAVRIFDTIDSVDSVRLGQRLSEELQKAGKTMPVLIEMNSSGEESKHGFEPEQMEDAVRELQKLPGMKLRGIMTIGPLTGEEKTIRSAFENTRLTFDSIRRSIPDFDLLSMGMSDDFEIAIEEGSNMVRIGRAVFEGR
jgi:PLP dependent protein